MKTYTLAERWAGRPVLGVWATVSPEQAGNITTGSRYKTITQRRASRDTVLYPSATNLEQ